MILRAINDDSKIFKTVDENISYIHFDQVLKDYQNLKVKVHGCHQQ